jgi:RNA polymerase sigma factor (TIGR02999 family)
MADAGDTPGNDDPTAAVTRLLNQASSASDAAAAELLPLVYEQLRALASRRMRQERPDLTLQATALVHEAYVRLVDEPRVRRWENRWRFFAAAAEAMRRILVEHARRKHRLKRGGDQQRVDLDGVALTLAADGPHAELLALDEALKELAEQYPQEARLVNLRYFAGLTMDEAAQALGVSARTAARCWAFARAWLYRRLNEP